MRPNGFDGPLVDGDPSFCALETNAQMNSSRPIRTGTIGRCFLRAPNSTSHRGIVSSSRADSVAWAWLSHDMTLYMREAWTRTRPKEAVGACCVGRKEAETPSGSVPSTAIDGPKTELDRPFTLGDFVAALAQRKTRSAPGHDGVTWQELRDLRNKAQDKLLAIINESWKSAVVPNSLKLSHIYATPKLGKALRVPANLRL
ncbi:hypothetical protein HPB50_021869 [Hyalomma asiaticum]|uniref:Uncharacterized protein n=1 Tax=Hyalomma asiaticum TaxID=266040 RepID=A0ACB7T0X7_HYAAI|nr:hypothetical protein HPB50_021869 [Hyalomma asiaticum]